MFTAVSMKKGYGSHFDWHLLCKLLGQEQQAQIHLPMLALDTVKTHEPE